jgi:hypothetical protein
MSDTREKNGPDRSQSARDREGEERREANLEMAREGGYDESDATDIRTERATDGDPVERAEADQEAEERAEEVLRGGRLLG